MNRTLRILLSLIVFLIPVSGIYWGTQVLYPNHHVWGLLVGIASMIILMPMSGVLFDAITNYRVLYFNVNKPWECHLKKE